MKTALFRILPFAALLAVLLAAAGTAAAQQQQVSFGSPDTYPTNPAETEITNVTNADFNGDRRLDLAVTNTSTGSFSVLLNDGDGTFGDAITTSVPCPDGQPPQGDPPNCSGASSSGGARPMGIVSADFNLDRKADIAVTSPPTGSFYVFFGNGDGNFEFGQTYQAGTGAFGQSGIRTFGITRADFNRDGRPDVAVTNLGCCSPRFPLPPGSTQFDNDTVAVFLNNPSRARGQNGTFERLQLLSAGDSASSVTNADFNGDLRLDLAVTNDRAPGATRPRSDDVSVYLQNRDGTFGVPPSEENRDSNNPELFVPNAEYAAGDGPTAIASANFNRDLKPDLVVANLNSDDVSVLLNNGDGTFGDAQPYPAGNGPRGVTVADFDLDRDLDFAVSYQNETTTPILSVFLNNNRDGTFAGRQNFPGGANSRGITSANFNRDFKPDLAAPDRGTPATEPDSVLVLLNNTSRGPSNDESLAKTNKEKIQQEGTNATQATDQEATEG